MEAIIHVFHDGFDIEDILSNTDFDTHSVLFLREQHVSSSALDLHDSREFWRLPEKAKSTENVAALQFFNLTKKILNGVI